MSTPNRTFRQIKLPDNSGRICLCALRFDEEAVAEYTDWMNNTEVIKYLGRSAIPTSIESEKEWLDRQLTKGTSETTFNIVFRTDKYDKLVGNCSLITPNNSIHNGIIGILIGNDAYRNRKFGRYALQMLLDFAFNEKNLESVSLTVSEENLAAIKCYESVGFKKQGIHRNTFYYEGNYHNAIYMDILREEYKNLAK